VAGEDLISRYAYGWLMLMLCIYDDVDESVLMLSMVIVMMLVMKKCLC
jgi:hypothetical protein